MHGAREKHTKQTNQKTVIAGKSMQRYKINVSHQQAIQCFGYASGFHAIVWATVWICLTWLALPVISWTTGDLSAGNEHVKVKNVDVEYLDL